MNRLQYENSPYLLQHAANPVDWYPWTEEAFDRAQRENKLVFLSIGYSTCHWCHVMEQESFDDAEVAAIMNETFISIKVDREERPDIDSIYMSLCQMMTGRGGWPLTIIMTPDQRPFFAATYIPKLSRFGIIGMIELIPNIKKLWVNQRYELTSMANKVTHMFIDAQNSGQGGTFPDPKTVEKAYEQLLSIYDSEYGGFGSQPKFPSPHNLLFLLEYYIWRGDDRVLQMVENTLIKMRSGGIYDHVGYGFHRYSTDRQWLLPHFEKMLYDQALLMIAYVKAYRITSNELFKQTACEIADYVLRDLADEKGGFYCAEDADSEGEEGKYYLWDRKEFEACLDHEEMKLFNIQAEEKNIIYVENIALKQGMDGALKKLFIQRQKRPRPHRDDKILVDWNSLMIVALTIAGHTLDHKPYTVAAIKAADFIVNTMFDKNTKRLLRRYRSGNVAINGNLDDYVFFIWALIELYESTVDDQYLQLCLTLTEHLLDNFWDNERGAFFLTPSYGERFLIRPKEIYDGALPSGNSVSLINMIRLEKITGNPDFRQIAQQIGKAFALTVSQAPQAYTCFVNGILLAQNYL
ncbi:MAG: thioredoxin domain-containing protein [Candidatus Magnetoovum sp. WYHC-5]|nr:thioredoxin domain-containing protein [Candidatus Magnetoovum sp. WYHC-5]